jgi:hypothetical protein
VVDDEDDKDTEPTTREQRAYALLEHRIRDSIEYVNASNELALAADDIEALVFELASEISYSFEVDWDPDWVGPGDFHAWTEADGTRARCPMCLLDSPPSPTKDLAVTWVRSHIAAEHPGDVAW